jgi:Mn2+/Fe2+ NRAMP family transporter
MGSSERDRTRYPRWVLWFACALVIPANIFNIGADLGGMADAMQMMTGVRSYVWTPFFAPTILVLMMWTSGGRKQLPSPFMA